jgi:hypothetical protein
MAHNPPSGGHRSANLRKRRKTEQKAGGNRRRPRKTASELCHSLRWRTAECALVIFVNVEHGG